MRTLIFACCLLAACGGPNRAQPDMGEEGQRPAGGEPMPCTMCRTDQVCANGVCTDLPKQCPCPIESYCDLSNNTCKPGCTEDAQCSTGRICDVAARKCKDGCRGDTGCVLGKICEQEACVPGCRKDGDCQSGQICKSNQCISGCRGDGACGAGQICDAEQCRRRRIDGERSECERAVRNP